MAEDPLQLCPVEKWFELQEIFKSDLPRSISGFTVLQNERYILECGIDYGFKVYCPFGDGKNGIIAINLKKTFYEIIVQCPSDDTTKLELALKTTNIIDWEREMEVPYAPKHMMDCVKRIIDEKKLKIQHISKGLNQMIVQCPSNDTSKLEDALKTTSLIDWEKDDEIPFVTNNVINCIQRVAEIKNVAIDLTPCLTFALDKSSTLFDVTAPPEFSFELLSLEHADLIGATWPHRYDGSDFYFEYIIKAKLGYGLFKEKKLVSWALVRDTGPLLHLFTVQEERRKGYGELVLKLISNVLLKMNKYVVAYCVKDNINALKLYQKLNFQLESEIDWLILTKKS